MNCRGTVTRQRIVKEYNVKPVAHIQLLAGQTKHVESVVLMTRERDEKSFGRFESDRFMIFGFNIRV